MSQLCDTLFITATTDLNLQRLHALCCRRSAYVLPTLDSVLKLLQAIGRELDSILGNIQLKQKKRR
jgi:hypothetical protein